MKILIATPAFGGIITTRYMECFLQTMGEIGSLGHQITIGLSDRDALISRARNHLATVAMENDFDKVLFIDADNVWKPEHVFTLLKSDKHIVGGTYPYKAFPIRMVLNPLQEHYYVLQSRKCVS
jgi:hypothetical protein